MCPHSSHTQTVTAPEYIGPSRAFGRAKSNRNIPLTLLECWHGSGAISPPAETGDATYSPSDVPVEAEHPKVNWRKGVLSLQLPLIYTQSSGCQHLFLAIAPLARSGLMGTAGITSQARCQASGKQIVRGHPGQQKFR